jgi:BirA family biotin operon repressor/biotin-[acetyl-CoA-carboxylase] ligase
VIAGIGVNLTTAAHELPPGATSLAAEGGAAVPAARVAERVVAGVARHIASLEAGAALAGPWRERLSTLGQPVVVRSAAGAVMIRGRAVAARDDGALVVETPDGERHPVHAGDVTLADEAV